MNGSEQNRPSLVVKADDDAGFGQLLSVTSRPAFRIADLRDVMVQRK